MTLIRGNEPLVQQKMAVAQRLIPATCAEVNCPLYLYGDEWIVNSPATGGKAVRIRHEAGWECGERCPNEVCPCVNNGIVRGAGGYPHVKADPGSLSYAAKESDRHGNWGQPHRAEESEILDRIGEGVHALQFARTRGR